MTIDSVPKQKPSWPMLMLGAGLIAAVLTLAALNNAFSLGDETLIQSYLQRLNAFPKNTQQVQVFVAAPGKQVNLEIQAGKSIKGLWASEGLSISISETGSNPAEPAAVISQEKTWDENIQHNAIFERRDAIYIPAEFILASDTVVGRNLQGTIQGNLVYPIIAANGIQEDATYSISVPFVIRVVPPAEIAQAVRSKAKTTLWITSPIALILIAISVAYFRKHRRPKGNPRLDRPESGK